MYDAWPVYRDGSLHRHAILVAVDRDGVLDGFLGGPDNHLGRCAVDGYTCTGAAGVVTLFKASGEASQGCQVWWQSLSDHRSCRWMNPPIVTPTY